MARQRNAVVAPPRATRDRRGRDRANTRDVARTWYRQGIRDFVWMLDLDDDATGDPSILKGVALLFAITTVWPVFVWHERIGGWDLAFGFLAVCAYFGYKGAKLFQAWKGVPTLAETRNVAESTIHTIEERRDAARGFEHTP